MPISLIDKARRATIVFDAVNRTEAGENVLLRQYRAFFAPEEHFFLAEDNFAYQQADATGRFEALLRERIEARRLHDTACLINLVFYEDVCRLDEERVGALFSFIDSVSALLASPTSRIRAYLCVCKERGNGAGNRDRMTRLIERTAENATGSRPRLILVDALPLKPISPFLRTTVRVMHILSRDNALSQRLDSEPPDRIWSWTMSEYDVDASVSLMEKMHELDRLIADRNAFPAGALAEKAKALLSLEAQKRIARPIVAERIPIPCDAVGGVSNMLFGQSKLQEQLDTLAALVRVNFERNTAARSLIPPSEQELDDCCRALIGQIPCNHLPAVSEQLYALYPPQEKTFAAPNISLAPCSGLDKLRQQIADGLQFLYGKLNVYWLRDFAGRIAMHMPTYLAKTDVLAERLAEQDRLKSLLISWGGETFATPNSYLKSIKSIATRLNAVYCPFFFERRDFLLTSHSTVPDWRKYQDDVPSDIRVDDIYDYGDLGEYEFQALTLLTFRREEYDKGANMIFRLPEQGGNA